MAQLRLPAAPGGPKPGPAPQRSRRPHGIIGAASAGDSSVDSQTRELRIRLIGLVQRLLAPAVLAADAFPVDSKLSDLGISSLKMVNLMLALEVEFDITIPQSDITPENFHSLASVEALIARTVGAKPRA